MPGLTLRSLLRQRERSQCDVSRHLWFPANVYEMTLASRPASPGTNVPSRNRSAPLELWHQSTGHRVGVLSGFETGAARLPQPPSDTLTRIQFLESPPIDVRVSAKTPVSLSP